MLTRLFPKRALLTRLAFRFSEEEEETPEEVEAKMRQKKINELQRKFSGEVKIQQKFHGKTSALYDRYLQVRQRPLVCYDQHLLAYQLVIERLPIFAPYQAKNFETQRNRYIYAKKTGFYVPIPSQLKIDQAENPFKSYDEANQQNAISHQIVLSQTEKINYRQNSRMWKFADPNIIDPHSIQTYSANNVFLIVKEKGQWKFPTKIINQKDVHSKVFDLMSDMLFQGTKYPVVHFGNKKPMGIRKTNIDGFDKPVKIMTFKGVSAFGIPQFPAANYEDFAWVPKPLLADYFSDDYFQASAWAATHSFY